MLVPRNIHAGETAALGKLLLVILTAAFVLLCPSAGPVHYGAAARQIETAAQGVNAPVIAQAASRTHTSAMRFL